MQVRGLAALIGVLLATSAIAPGSAWYPDPSSHQLDEYVQLHTYISSVHWIPTSSQAALLAHVEFRLPYGRVERIYLQPGHLETFSREVQRLAPIVKEEIQGPLSPYNIGRQKYNAIDQRLIYYRRVTQVAQVYDAELREMRIDPEHETLQRDLDVIRQAHRLLDIVLPWNWRVGT